VKDDKEIEIIWGPFSEIELKMLELEEGEYIEEQKFEKEMEVDEDYQIKCGICPKANYDEGY